MNDDDRRKLNTFIDYFRAVSAYHEHRTVNPGFWDYLYSNQHFRHARVNSAAQAFLIGLDVSVHNRDMGRASELEVFQPGIMKALFKKDAEFTGLPAPKGLSTTARVIKLITRANQLMDEMGINSSVEVYQATNDAGFEILNGNSSAHTLNFNRKATKDEFLIAMSFLRKAVLRGKPDSLQGKIIYAPYPESLGGDNLRKLQRHRQNVSLCAAWIMEEGAASVSEAIRLRGVASRVGLSPEEVKNRLYKMEDNFAGYGYFIKDRAALERELD